MIDWNLVPTIIVAQFIGSVVTMTIAVVIRLWAEMLKH